MNFKYIHVVTVQNGVTWSVEQLCNQIITAYKAFDQKVEIIVWLDRETRSETADEMRLAVFAALIGAGAESSMIHIIVNDRMSENLILSDESVIKSVFDDDSYEYKFEGKHGKSILKQFYKNIDINYKEMVHGVGLLKKIRLKDCANKSNCLASFVNTFSKECWWVDERG